MRRLATADFVLFEVFEVLPLISAVMKAEGKLLCLYPGPAIQIPADIFMDKCFLRELSTFLVQMDVDRLDPTPSNVYDAAHPRHISELLVGILRGYGQPAVVDRITKRIGDEVRLFTVDEPSLDKRWWDKLSQWRDKLLRRQDEQKQREPWRRSPLWLILRVTLQSSLCSGSLYKLFVLFFHAYLLRICVNRDFPSEQLFVMRVKMARRLSKLGLAVAHHVYQFVYETARETEGLLSRRWIAFQDIGSTCLTSQLKGLDFVADSNISLDNSYKYLTKMLCSASRGFKQNRFTPSRTFRLYEVHDLTQFANGQLARAIAEDPYIALADFELSVERNLESWVAASTSHDDTLDVIASCIQQYYSGAQRLYRANPEDNSIMILTIMDLWVALDRITIQECPLLKEYPPGIPSNFLHCLLLHRSSSLKHASHIEEYLIQRHKKALEMPSVFSNSVSDSSLAVKYFRTSENLQRIYNAITTHARQKRTRKREELTSMKQESKSLLDQASMMVHEKRNDYSGREIHKSACRKCSLQDQAKTSMIRIHEWPLPRSTIHAQWVVFELSPPHAFSAWRDITYMILRDIGMPSVPNSKIRPNFFLDSFPDVRQWLPPHQKEHRVAIASSAPSSHDPVVSIFAEESLVFVDNQLSYQLFDRFHNSWAIGTCSESSPSNLCAPPMPKSSPYGHFHPFVSGTEHTPNDIIAAQGDCPEGINLHEFLAFSGLRSGPRLQWLNIARELASPFLSFRREEVHTLVTQAAWQLGPLSNGVREWHVDLGVFSFANALLREMGRLLEKIKANWLEEVTVRTIGMLMDLLSAILSHLFLALICSRLLASTTDSDISGRAYALLREARNVTHRWISEVQEKIYSMQIETSCAGLRYQLCMLAATCLSTFDVCSDHVANVLISEEDFSIAMQCAVIFHDNTPSSSSTGEEENSFAEHPGAVTPTSPTSILNFCDTLRLCSTDRELYRARLLSRHRRLLHNLESIVSRSLSPLPDRAALLHAGAYDDALAQLRLRRRQGNPLGWYTLPRPNSRWISGITSERQEVYYDLLTGKLTIGGNQLGQLPQKIVEHPTYKRMFGVVSDQRQYLILFDLS